MTVAFHGVINLSMKVAYSIISSKSIHIYIPVNSARCILNTQFTTTLVVKIINSSYGFLLFWVFYILKHPCNYLYVYITDIIYIQLQFKYSIHVIYAITVYKILYTREPLAHVYMCMHVGGLNRLATPLRHVYYVHPTQSSATSARVKS